MAAHLSSIAPSYGKFDRFALFSCRFLRFSHARIPRFSLLNRNSDITPDGRYISAFKDEKKRFSAALGTLSGGRVSITGIGVTNLKLAITIGIR